MKKVLSGSVFIITDIFLLVIIFYFAQYIRTMISCENIPVFKESSLEDFFFIIVISVSVMFYEKIYTLRYDFWQETYKVLKSLLLAYFIALAFLTLQKTSLMYSRLFITLYFLLAIFFIPIFKRLMKKFIYHFLFFKKRVLIIGEKSQVAIFEKEFNENWYLGMSSCKKDYDAVIISSKSLELERMNVKIEKYLKDNDEVYVVPYVTTINFAHSSILEYSNIRYNTIQIQNKLLIKRNILIKNAFDFIVLVVIFPLFLLIHSFIAILIKLDSKGSVLFKQERLGKDNIVFTCYKYRTMYENSEDLLQRYLNEHPEEVDYYETYHKYKNDPRITKVGRFLRSSSLDELIQLVNILKGEMSFVGPRPYMTTELSKLSTNHEFILKVKPGITGLWQVSGRNNLTFKERNELEVWYIKNWSLWADFVILIKTIKVVLGKVGAK